MATSKIEICGCNAASDWIMLQILKTLAGHTVFDLSACLFVRTLCFFYASNLYRCSLGS